MLNKRLGPKDPLDIFALSFSDSGLKRRGARSCSRLLPAPPGDPLCLHHYSLRGRNGHFSWGCQNPVPVTGTGTLLQPARGEGPRSRPRLQCPPIRGHSASCQRSRDEDGVCRRRQVSPTYGAGDSTFCLGLSDTPTSRTYVVAKISRVSRGPMCPLSPQGSGEPLSEPRRGGAFA